MKSFILSLILISQVLLCFSQDDYQALLKARALCSQARYTDAINMLSSQPGIGKSAELLCARGDAYLSAGMIRQASSDFALAESLTPGKGLYGMAKAAAWRTCGWRSSISSISRGNIFSPPRLIISLLRPLINK